MWHRVTTIGISSALLVWLLAACSGYTPSEINYGTDECDYCKMTIADDKFGTEIITSKGRVLKFDSIECMAAADINSTKNDLAIHSRWVTDFNSPRTFMKADAALIVATLHQNSPMGIGLVAVDSHTKAAGLIARAGGSIVTWDETKALVTKAWNLK
ncbi:MAG: nitrous oxide reductase accessory protein NosL [Candidatus Zixiibacteriota bacterium]